jgi:hypothetical protein
MRVKASVRAGKILARDGGFLLKPALEKLESPGGILKGCNFEEHAGEII